MLIDRIPVKRLFFDKGKPKNRAIAKEVSYGFI